jgi:ATP-binding cassette, subfamily B (MDR/TAP), member 1
VCVSISFVYRSTGTCSLSALGIGQASPSFETFAIARGAAPRVFGIIDRQSAIDPLSGKGTIPETVAGKISFENVEFNYKSREIEGGAPILQNLNLEILPGTTHALVGPSGCGKSSMMGLIERFYDPKAGRILLDGVDIRELNVRWLRSQMGFVGQMPSLFRGTIRENIAFGASICIASTENTPDNKTSSLKRVKVSDEEIVAAATLANAHSFICDLPEGYNTVLGERGALLSGGQKQRICIARAIVRNPKILLLDEATSALDAKAERSVQEALEQAAKGRTTLIIAHRLSTIRNANVISVFEEGGIVECGRHEELIQIPNGVYRGLLEQQLHYKPKLSAGAQVDNVKTTQTQNQGQHEEKTETYKAKTETYREETGKSKGSADRGSTSHVDEGVILRSFKMNIGEWAFIVAGMVGAAIAGASWPLGALVFSQVTSLLTDPKRKNEIVFWARIVVAIGGGAFIGNLLQFGMLGVSGERLTRKLRILSFRALLRQDMGYFDEKDNSVGALTTRLATEATLVKGITGNMLGIATFTASTIGLGVGIAFSACWRLALVVLSLIPFVAAGGYFQVKMMSGFDAGSKLEFATAGSVASEAVDNIRSVTSLGIQDVFMERYSAALVIPLKNGSKAANVTGIAFGVGEAFTFVMWAAAFWAGAKFIAQGHCTFLDLMKAVAGLLFAGMSLGSVAALLPNLSEASVAATKIFRLLDRESPIDPSVSSGKILGAVKGSVDFGEAQFAYPTRPDVEVLRGMSLSISPGRTLALVGQSGCGKSTVVSLLERFYDIRAGSIKFEDTELREVNLQNVRSHMGFVQQEPDLFNRTIRENILYGLPHEEGTPITDEQIISAAKAANAHDFISELPLGYDTLVGERGSGLSGGQRQRIAIARSLIRKPRLLLLDEATSALDARNEQDVQRALDEARQGRTTIVIAHRLSTVTDADSIGVVAQGQIVELGSHEELMAKNGQYADLVRNQLSDHGE